MICPVCKRELAATLSICFGCGAMMHDSVREELETKISVAPARRQSAELPPIQRQVATVEPQKPVIMAPPPDFKLPAERILSKPVAVEPRPAPAEKVETSAISPRKTSPTLVGFQPKTAVVPDWRLQLQNSIRQRTSPEPKTDAKRALEARRPFATNGAAALKSEPIVDSEVAPHQNPRVANALRRIEESRRAFLNDSSEPAPSVPSSTAQAPVRPRPFNVVAGTPKTAEKTQGPMISAQPRPILVSTLKIEKRKYDTNKLPPIAFDDVPPAPAGRAESDLSAEARLADMEIGGTLAGSDETAGHVELPFEEVETLTSEADSDDLAPLSMRFNAALFDVMIGGFLGLALLSPFMIAGGDWFSVPGVLAVAGGVFIVLFLYLTVSLGIYGQTFGMRLFSLELIDADENEYPTLHQAAVHSAVFILSLAGAGLGFLPMFFNEERRAAHDLVSGTILVREY